MKSLVVLPLCAVLAAAPAPTLAQTAQSVPATPTAPATTDCLAGAYRLENGQTLDLAPA